MTYSGDRAFCWGDNGAGQLGIGNNTGPEVFVADGHNFPYSTKPVAVLGGLTFRHVTPGYDHTCGVTTDNRVFCWGSNRYGQVGDSSAGWWKFKPRLVAGNRQYRQVDAGQTYTCAVTTGNRAFCWGRNQEGQLGNGTQSSSRYPKPVSGGLSFERVSAGAGFHTCAETTANRAYCWGSNGVGKLGDGTTTKSLTPVAVVGGLSFNQVSAGGAHSCGKTPEGRAYCWGGLHRTARQRHDRHQIARPRCRSPGHDRVRRRGRAGGYGPAPRAACRKAGPIGRGRVLRPESGGVASLRQGRLGGSGLAGGSWEG